jgi:hypothetical protein
MLGLYKNKHINTLNSIFMKKSIFLFFAAILCSVSAWAYNVPAGYYIYFEKPSSWTQACLLIGKSGYSEGRKMTTISNTNLYYWKTVKWDGYTEYFFMQDEWGGENSSPTSSSVNNEPTFTNKIEGSLVDGEDYVDHAYTFDGENFVYDESMWYYNRLDQVPLPDPHVYVENGTYYIVGTSDRSVCKYVDCYYTKDFVTFEKAYNIFKSGKLSVKRLTYGT